MKLTHVLTCSVKSHKQICVLHSRTIYFLIHIHRASSSVCYQKTLQELWFQTLTVTITIQQFLPFHKRTL
uniref:Putative ovule protein n=1 Tax=Solanum chacoense TaxID=4108 RepID=A0A0V0H306_SOLCH